jgi:hypothetical protein
MVFQVVSALVELVRLGCQSESDKDLEILWLRRQLAIHERKQDHPIRLSQSEKLPLVVFGNQAHLRHVIRDYIEFFNTARPHQGIEQQIPVPQTSRQADGPVRCRNVLGVSFTTTTAMPHRRKSAYP